MRLLWSRNICVDLNQQTENAPHDAQKLAAAMVIQNRSVLANMAVARDWTDTILKVGQQLSEVRAAYIAGCCSEITSLLAV